MAGYFQHGAIIGCRNFLISEKGAAHSRRPFLYINTEPLRGSGGRVGGTLTLIYYVTIEIL